MILCIDRNQTAALPLQWSMANHLFDIFSVCVCICMLRRDTASAFLSLTQCLFSPLAAHQDNLEQSTGYPWINNGNMGSEVWSVCCDQQRKIKITNRHFLYKVIGCSEKGTQKYVKNNHQKGQRWRKKDKIFRMHCICPLESETPSFVSLVLYSIFISSVKMIVWNIIRHLSRSVFNIGWMSAGENLTSLMYQSVHL